MDKKKFLKGAGLVLAGLVIGGIGGSLAFSGSGFDDGFNAGKSSVVIPKIPDVNAIRADAFQAGVDSVKPVVETEYVTKYVDNGNLGEVLSFLMDENGDISFITNGLDDDEADLIVDYIFKTLEVKDLAVKSVKKKLFNELNNVEVVFSDNSSVKLDDDEMRRLKVDEDFEDVVVQSYDFEDDDFDVLVTGRFEQDDVWFNYEAVVKIRDGSFDEIGEVSVSEMD